MVSLLCMMQTSSVLQAFPPPEGEREDAGREFAAVGAGNVLAGLVGAFPVDASPPRTAIVTAAGGRTRRAGCLPSPSSSSSPGSPATRWRRSRTRRSRGS